MPYKTVQFDPEVAFTLDDGTRIFHTYHKNGSVNRVRYTTSPDEDDDKFTFDMLYIAMLMGTRPLDTDEEHVIVWGIENGHIKIPDGINDSAFNFYVTLRGRGANLDDAWLDAVEALSLEPGPCPDDFTREYDE